MSGADKIDRVAGDTDPNRAPPGCDDGVRFRSLFEASPLGMARVADDGVVAEANGAFRALYGSEPTGKAFADMLREADRTVGRDALVDAVAFGRAGPFEVHLGRPDGGEAFVLMQVAMIPSGGAAGERALWVVAQDISDRKRLDNAVWQAAHHDVLTGLPNRTYLGEYLAGKLAGRDGPGSHFGLLLVDIDNFKLVNDTLGHEAGDALLKTIADRLRLSVRRRDLVARLGGDEFAVVASNVRSVAALKRLADRVLADFAQRLPCVNGTIQTFGSVGMALFPAHGRDAKELIRSADIALYVAKRSGHNRAVMFDATMLQDARRRFEAIQIVRQAVAEDRIVPVYQPIVDIRTGALHSFEALFRVRTPDGQLVGPADLKSVFDNPEVGRAVDLKMLDLVTADLADWVARGVDVRQVAVNVCDAELWRNRYDQRILQFMASRNIPAGRVMVEVTETAFLDADGHDVAPTLSNLVEHDIPIALDDFGTGFASLTHLKTLPIQQVKVDRSFIADIENDPTSRAIVTALVDLCGKLGKKLVAEGVETKHQLAALEELGCRFVQGFLLARPMEKAEAELFALRCLAERMKRSGPPIDGHRHGEARLAAG